jgi:site-specific DNA recombinase
MSKATVRCAAYTRKSSEEGLEQAFNSLEAQREACIAYIQSQKHEGWVPVEEPYDDGGFSGGNMERPALVRLLDDIRAGKVQIVVVYKVDRLTRSLSDFAKIIEVLDSQQASFVSVTQQFNTTTSMGRLTLNVLLSFAQFERELTGERIRDKVAASKRKGMWMGGVVPLGYRCANHRLIVQPAEAKTVRDIFTQYLRLGSVGLLKAYLDRHGIRSTVRTSASGRTWGGVAYSRGALYQLLNNRTYIGKITHRDQCYPGQHELIIGQGLWDRVAAQLKVNNQVRRARNSRSASSLLTGLLRDTHGVRFTPTHAVKNGRQYRYYTSQAAIHGRADCPPISRYPAKEIESLVVAQVHRLLGSLDSYFAEGQQTAEDALAVERGQKLGQQWPTMAASKQHELVRDVIKAVIVGPKNLWVEVERATLLRALLGHSSSGSGLLDGRKQTTIKLTADFRTVRRGAELQIQAPGDLTARPPVPSLISAIARARRWYEQLVSGDITSIEQLAKQTGLNRRYLRQALRCATLSPEVTEAILAGRQARQIIGRNLLKGVPLDWQKQAEVLL